MATSPVPKGCCRLRKTSAAWAACPPPAGSPPGYRAPSGLGLGHRPELASWVGVSGPGRSPEVQLQLRVQEVEQCPPGHGLRVAVVDHQPLVVDVLAADALGPRGQDDDLRLPDVQACGAEEASEPRAALPDHRTASRARRCRLVSGGTASGDARPGRLRTKAHPRGTRGRLVGWAG